MLLAALIGLAACTSDSSAIDPSAASSRIVEELRLPASVEGCLEDRFEAAPQARRALDPAEAPSDHELDALSEVVSTCVPPEIFANSVSAQMATGYRTVVDISAQDEACLRDQIAALPDDDRGLFVTGPVSRLRTPESERSLAVSELLGRLLASCDIVVGTAPPTDATPP